MKSAADFNEKNVITDELQRGGRRWWSGRACANGWEKGLPKIL